MATDLPLPVLHSITLTTAQGPSLFPTGCILPFAPSPGFLGTCGHSACTHLLADTDVALEDGWTVFKKRVKASARRLLYPPIAPLAPQTGLWTTRPPASTGSLQQVVQILTADSDDEDSAGKRTHATHWAPHHSPHAHPSASSLSSAGSSLQAPSSWFWEEPRHFGTLCACADRYEGDTPEPADRGGRYR